MPSLRNRCTFLVAGVLLTLPTIVVAQKSDLPSSAQNLTARIIEESDAAKPRKHVQDQPKAAVEKIANSVSKTASLRQLEQLHDHVSKIDCRSCHTTATSDRATATALRYLASNIDLATLHSEPTNLLIRQYYNPDSNQIKTSKFWIGVVTEPANETAVTVELSNAASETVLVNGGLKVTGVTQNSPAEKAGVEEGDVIYKLDGKPAKTVAQLSEVVREKEATTINVVVIRDKQLVHLEITPEKRPDARNLSVPLQALLSYRVALGSNQDSHWPVLHPAKRMSWFFPHSTEAHSSGSEQEILERLDKLQQEVAAIREMLEK
ncbi:MAG: PDZ domain-containing protein [Planctomycetota bacterium]